MGKELEKKFVWIGVLVFLLGVAWFLFGFDFHVWRSNLQTLEEGLDDELVWVRVGENSFLAEVVDSAEERAQGLSGRDSLEDGHGMLFLFDSLEVQSFWMKDMQFPIDIVWVLDGEVVGFEENVPIPEVGIFDSELLVYFSPVEVDVVLEVGAGVVGGLGIVVGDKVVFK